MSMLAAPRADSDLLTRRQLLLKGAGGAAGLALVGGGIAGAAGLLSGSGLRELPSYPSSFSHGAARDFVSRPDLHPPSAEVLGGGVSAGYLFLGPSAYGPVQAGSLLLD